MTKILALIKLILMMSPFLLMCFWIAKKNLSKEERSKQFVMPIVALIYSILAMIFVKKITALIYQLLLYIPILLMKLANADFMPASFSQNLYRWSDSLQNALEGFMNSFLMFVIVNVLLLFLYKIIKTSVLAICKKKVKRDGTGLHAAISEKIYEYFPARDVWVLQNGFGDTRKYLKVFYYATIVVSIILMIISKNMYSRHIFKSLFYPAFSVLIIGEIYFYIDGLLKREYCTDVLGEDEDAYKVANYSCLRKFFRAVFPDKILAENTTFNNEMNNSFTGVDILKELGQSEDPKEVAFSKFFERKSKEGLEIEHNYLYSALDLLQGKSLLFNNPFYNDFTPYIFYPMNRVLLQKRKVLVILGRHAIEKDIKNWLEEGLAEITNIPQMWSVGEIKDGTKDLDVGIVTRSDTYNIQLQQENEQFFKQVDFCLILEPSKIISTAQIGLSSLIKKCKEYEERKIVFCACDKNSDGLVDALSHILMTNIEIVSATEKHGGTSSYMCWKTDDEYVQHRLFPNIARYLGVGTELSFAGLKNQVSHVEWYGGEAFPVDDMRWIDRQYYYELLNYANLPTTQETMDDVFVTSSNFWSAKVKDTNYITVEDESCNMFEILRNFATRTQNQGFINVISSEYMLKEYMASNSGIFENDPKAIPNIVSDFARTGRNVALKLLLMLVSGEVLEDTIQKELALIGINKNSDITLTEQLWNEIYKCFTSTKDIDTKSDYVTVVKDVAKKSISLEGVAREFNIKLIQSKERYNPVTETMEIFYSVVDEDLIKKYIKELQSASYITEDEKYNKHFLGAELYGHIFQKHLPGQFFTFDGKYYEMQGISGDGNVIVRRAADHITGRETYRQIRKYMLENVYETDSLGSKKDIDGFILSRIFADIKVSTDAYFRMARYNDFNNAKRVEINAIPERIYKNKELIKINLPGQVDSKVRYTITTLLNESFRTFFADNQDYIVALTDFSDEEYGEYPLTYSISFDVANDEDRNCIYIAEDSQMDLGLLIAVERNIRRILEVIYDYLKWHVKTIEKSKEPNKEENDNLPDVEKMEEEAKEEKKKEKKSLWTKIKEKFGRTKDKNKDKTEKAEVDSTEKISDEVSDTEDNLSGKDENVTEVENTTGDIEKVSSGEEDTSSGEEGTATDTDKIISGEENTSSGEEESDNQDLANQSDEFKQLFNISPKFSSLYNEGDAEETTNNHSQDVSNDELEITKDEESSEEVQDSDEKIIKPYYKNNYLLFGFDEEMEKLDITGTIEYLGRMGMDNNSLEQARNGESEYENAVIDTSKQGISKRYCDFCGCEIIGIEYETLADGRDRCMRCGRTAIKDEEEFVKLFNDVKRNMESFFGININARVKVEMVNSQKLHKKLGMTFVPTAEMDGRVLGVAIKEKSGYTLMIENGSPRISSILTMAHELTHIWQYINWNEKDILKTYGKDLRLEVYEGMAKWVEIQYAYLINEPKTAILQQYHTLQRNDEYGRGFVRYAVKYPLSKGTYIERETPFSHKKNPL